MISGGLTDEFFGVMLFIELSVFFLLGFEFCRKLALLAAYVFYFV